MFEYVIRVSLHYAAQHHQHCAKMLKRKANYINSLLLENYSKFLKARAKDFYLQFFLLLFIIFYGSPMAIIKSVKIQYR